MIFFFLAFALRAQPQNSILFSQMKGLESAVEMSQRTLVDNVLHGFWFPTAIDDIDQTRDDNIKKKQDKYKKLRKNMGKALRYSWKCLVVGLQNLSTAYSMPLSAGATIVPDIQRARAHV